MQSVIYFFRHMSLFISTMNRVRDLRQIGHVYEVTYHWVR